MSIGSNKKIRIMSVVGARPNFMKIAPFMRELHKQDDIFESFLVHTGQHYDKEMSDSFFATLNIPAPDIDLGIGSGTHAEQVGKTMIEFEKVVKQWQPDIIVVVGDVNATCACSIVARKEQVKLAHIEAGLRSFDESMPEEINRMVTDRLADYLFTPDEFANRNLQNEGVPQEKIKFVGNIMIDTLDDNLAQAEQLDINDIIAENKILSSDHNIGYDQYVVLTMHRPSNVDRVDILSQWVQFINNDIASRIPVIWTVHPRTRKQLELYGLWESVTANQNIILVKPLGYLEMLKLNMSANLMITDSGGLQEECCVLGTPCITLRENTERPVTLREYGGISVLVGNDIEKAKITFNQLLQEKRRSYRPPLWDGHTADRIVELLKMAR